ncbi:MAG: hypothetical protein E7363_04920, partial [Clostridiales bacterium]|nr:hypothetical protein [Clostridiales bacterium]
MSCSVLTRLFSVVYNRREYGVTASNLDFDNPQGSSHPKFLASLVLLRFTPTAAENRARQGSLRIWGEMNL